ncbi:MAG: NADP-dependent phosphogluconate dehydrogenase [Nitratireductor sp.]
MTSQMTRSIGLVGLGTMGAALASNIAEKGFDIAVYNRTVQTTHDFVAQAGPLAPRITGCDTLEALVASMKPPRAIILMVPAGPVVDAQIAALAPLLAGNDLIIDAGNANFRDTNRRSEAAAKSGPAFLGMGVSGGEEGARHGPSIMGGGRKEHWDSVAPMLEAISAKADDGSPCATWMGEAGAGHFVKMVHNGIEYADMQMIAETYGMMRDGMGLAAADCGALFGKWNEGILKSYLVEISANVSNAVDPATGKPVLDIILDRAGQKGTGRWTVIEAQHLATPVSVIEAAVGARNVSAMLPVRKSGEALFGAAPERFATIPEAQALESAMIAGKILCYAQGFAMMEAASRDFGWSLPLPAIARVWRAGCIIRSAMLNDMAAALESDATSNLIFADYFSQLLKQHHGALRNVVSTAMLNGHAVPALSVGLAWFDQIRTGRSTANMIQAQRDFFGAHSFERIDSEGAHHGPWGLHSGT